MSVVTVIDRFMTARAAPRAQLPDPAAAAQLARLQALAAGRDAHGILELALLQMFPWRTAVVSSFGAESGALLHLVAEIDPTTPILFVNTGKLFGETLRYRDRLQDLLGLTDIRAIGPHPAERAREDSDGVLWSKDPDACCNLRKVRPLRAALAGFDAIVTGRKRFQTQTRAAMAPVEHFDGRFRFNPLADWTLAEIDAYFAAHALPRHPLVDDGYLSIGCIPCTRRLHAGEGYRDGRWSGLAKDECGIHTGMDGEGI